MNIEDLRLIYDYNYWATHRILSAAAKVAPEQYAAPAAFPYGSLRGTLFHTLDAEVGWRKLCQHNQMAFDLAEADFATFDQLEQLWREEEAAMRSYLGGLSDADLASLVLYTGDSGAKRERVLWHCLLHVASHSAQHRSEAAAIVTGLGHSPGDVDFTLFLNERRT